MKHLQGMVAGLLMLPAVVMALTQAMAVDPIKASWSGKVWPSAPEGGVGQSLVACFDSIEAVHLFIGGTGQAV